MTVISLRNVTKRFRGNDVIRNATFDIERGKTYGLVGRNGSGKSVLLKLICGFEVPTSGDIWIDPVYLDGRRSFPDRFGVAIDGPAYLPHLTGRRNLLDLANIRKRATAEEIDNTLSRVGLDPALKQKVRNYSLGMKQKLSLAQALIEMPEVLILDEPFNALDSASAAAMQDLLRAEQDRGTTIIFTSHHRDDIDGLSDVILEFNSGEIATMSR